jgi:hypothetical protein
MSYNHTTFAQAKQRLANELGDPGKVFFQDAELGRYIVEALRWWGLVAQYFRETGRLKTVAGQSFYYIESSLKDGTDTSFLQGLSVTDRELINDINYALMEPQIVSWPGGWIGTEMFSLEEITANLTDSRDEFLKLTACISSSYDLGVTQSRVDLPPDHIRILRADINETGSAGPLPLYVVDQSQLISTVRETSFPEQKRPRAYAISYSPQLTVDIWPPPQVASTLNIQGVRTGGTLTPTSSATILLVPDDASVLLKYRALHDLFSGDGLARAPQMAEYCEKRYSDGLEAMANYLSVLWSNDGGPRGQISVVSQWDSVRPDWRYANPGSPRSVAQLNWNTIAVRPKPNAEYVMTFETVRKAIIPTVDGDFIQVGREHMQAIYDYAQHVALVKSQGAEFEATMRLYESAKQSAEEYRQQIASQSYLYQATQLPSLQEKWFRPLRKQAPIEAAKSDRQLVEV